MNYKELKILNPWLRDDHLSNPQGKTYSIEIPS
jgi:membrane-bound lytic murein transglycosylase D